MIDDNKFLGEMNTDFETKLYEPEKPEPNKEQKQNQSKKRPGVTPKHLKFAGILIVATLIVIVAAVYLSYKQSSSTETKLLSADTADIPSFDDYINSNIGINFRYPHLWQVYDTSEKIVIANCADADRATCQNATNGVRITIKKVDMPTDFQYRRTTEKGNTIYVNDTSYFVADPVTTYQIDETGLTDANRDPIMNRIFDSIVINYITD